LIVEIVAFCALLHTGQPVAKAMGDMDMDEFLDGGFEDIDVSASDEEAGSDGSDSLSEGSQEDEQMGDGFDDDSAGV
jgi:hypothetical protein